ncbi:hypothetical protein D3C87_2135360 [compost metagenome]
MGANHNSLARMIAQNLLQRLYGPLFADTVRLPAVFQHKIRLREHLLQKRIQLRVLQRTVVFRPAFFF